MNADPAVGDIWRVVSEGVHSVLALVTSTREWGYTGVTLLSPDVCFGSSADIFLPAWMIGRGYDLLAESDIFGYVWTSQLDRYICHVGGRAPEAVASLSAGDAVSWPTGGPPISGRNDPRWQFKLNELRRFQDVSLLASDCVSTLLGD